MKKKNNYFIIMFCWWCWDDDGGCTNELSTWTGADSARDRAKARPNAQHLKRWEKQSVEVSISRFQRPADAAIGWHGN